MPDTVTLTEEMRRKGAEMLHECAYVLPGGVRCRARATSMVRFGPNAWHYRCREHEGRVNEVHTSAEVRPITLVPPVEDVLTDPDWLIRTAAWRLGGGADDPQARDMSGRDLYDVLTARVGPDEASRIWRAACDLSDRETAPEEYAAETVTVTWTAARAQVRGLLADLRGQGLHETSEPARRLLAAIVDCTGEE